MISVIVIVVLVVLWWMGKFDDLHPMFAKSRSWVQGEAEGFQTATDAAMSRFGYEPPNATGYRVKARAFHSCDLPEDCPAQMNKAESSQFVIANPFVWPYSGSSTPHEIVNKSLPSATVWAGDYVMGNEPDHEPVV